jgi:hypothetical protein
MRHLVYNVRYSVVSINSSLLSVRMHSLVIKTLVYKETKHSATSTTLELRQTVHTFQNKFVPLQEPCCMFRVSCETCKYTLRVKEKRLPDKVCGTVNNHCAFECR